MVRRQTDGYTVNGGVAGVQNSLTGGRPVIIVVRTGVDSLLSNHWVSTALHQGNVMHIIDLRVGVLFGEFLTPVDIERWDR